MSARGAAAMGDQLAARVIPCLDVESGRVVKGVNFVGLRDAGDPVELARRYELAGADELVLLDITASSDSRGIILDVVERCAAELDAAGVVLVCYDDQLTAFPDGSIDPAAARACTDGQDYAASCLSASHAQANALSGPDNADRVRACAKEEPWIRAVRSGDCQGAIDAWLDREPRGYAL